jgi:hypothetical protein
MRGTIAAKERSTSQASAASRYFIPIPSLNNSNFSNLFNSWISYLRMKPKGEKVR